MKYFLAVLVSLALIAGCKENTKKENTTEDVPTIKMVDFHTVAGDFVDQEIMIEGVVDHVCRHGGKKLFLVTDDDDLHVEWDKRFDEELTGAKIMVKGLVREFRVDEGYCLKMEEDNIQRHKTGETDQDYYDRINEEIQWYRDSMMMSNSDHLSFYTVEYLGHEEITPPPLENTVDSTQT